MEPIYFELLLRKKNLFSAFRLITGRNSPVPCPFSTRKSVKMNCCGKGFSTEMAALEISDLPLSLAPSTVFPGQLSDESTTDAGVWGKLFCTLIPPEESICSLWASSNLSRNVRVCLLFDWPKVTRRSRSTSTFIKLIKSFTTSHQL